MDEPRFELTQIGTVESPLTDPASAPKQGDEGAPDAWLNFAPAVLQGLEGLRAGDEVIVLTWLHRARRDVLRVHPRGDTSRPQQGVFNTRSPDRPNPIGRTECRSCRSTAPGFRCATWKRWTGRRSSTSSRRSEATSASAECPSLLPCAPFRKAPRRAT